MFFYQIGQPGAKLPFRTKAAMILGIVAALSVLAVFAFTLFLVALCGGLVLLVMNLFRKPAPPASPPGACRPYQPPRARNDDVIDI
ncbi:MAG: hypothetical protein ACE5G9_08350 [Nitrospinales bacterium]